MRHRAEVAEAIAAERQQTLAVLHVANDSERMVLRMLARGSRTPATQDAPATSASSDFQALFTECPQPYPRTYKRLLALPLGVCPQRVLTRPSDPALVRVWEQLQDRWEA